MNGNVIAPHIISRPAHENLAAVHETKRRKELCDTANYRMMLRYSRGKAGGDIVKR